MRVLVRSSSVFATLFGSRFGLVDHPKAWRWSDHRSLWSSARFSAWFGRTSRCPQLRHNFQHRAAHLLRAGWTLARLPGTQHRLHERMGQRQLIVKDGHNLTPAFKLCRGAQPRFGPQQALLVKAIAMLVRVAPSIPQGHCSDASVRRPIPQKPTLARIARLIGGALAQYADDRHLNVPGLGQMQPRPPSDLHRMAVRIAALPTPSGWPIRAGVAALKALTVFARRSPFTCGGRCWAIQHPLALYRCIKTK